MHSSTELSYKKQRDITIECLCCYLEHPLSNMVSCTLGHLFCIECSMRAIETLIVHFKTDMKCFSTTDCNGYFDELAIQTCLPATSYKRYQVLCEEVALKKANISGLERCPFCPYAVINEFTEKDSLFYCQRQDCFKISCNRCKKVDHRPNPCQDLLEHSVAEAMSSALLRECPKCKMRYYKTEGCNKMTCVCGQSMCYVCRSPISKGYNHFMDKKCPLWDDSASRNLEDVTRAKTIRLNAIGKMIPNDLPATLIDNPNGSLVNDPQNGKRMDPLRNAVEPLPQPTQDIRPNINLLHHIRRRKAVIIKASALQREANPPHHNRQILPVRPKQAVGQLNPPNDIIEQVLPQKPAKVKRIMDPQETTNLVAKINRIRRRRGDIIKELDLQPERNPPHHIRQILPVKPEQAAGQLNPPNLIVEPEISHRPVNIKKIIYPRDLPGKPTEDAGQMVASINAAGPMLPRKHRKTTRTKPKISREVVDLSEDIVVRPRPPSIEIIDISDDGIGSVSPFTISKKKRPNI